MEFAVAAQTCRLVVRAGTYDLIRKNCNSFSALNLEHGMRVLTKAKEAVKPFHVGYRYSTDHCHKGLRAVLLAQKKRGPYYYIGQCPSEQIYHIDKHMPAAKRLTATLRTAFQVLRHGVNGAANKLLPQRFQQMCYTLFPAAQSSIPYKMQVCIATSHIVSKRKDGSGTAVGVLQSHNQGPLQIKAQTC